MRHRYTDEPEHPSVRAAKDLRAIARTWPHLEAALARTGTPGQGGGKPTKSASQPLVINAHVSDVMAEIRGWLAFWLHALLDEADDYVLPVDTRTPARLESLALRVGHWTEHPDELLRVTFVQECHDNARKAHQTAHPNGSRRLRINEPCRAVMPDDTPCPGTYTALSNPDGNGLLPDLVCTINRKEHRIPPSVWRRWQLAPTNEEATRQLLKAIKG